MTVVRRRVSLPVLSDADRAFDRWDQIERNRTRPPPTRAHCIIFDEATQRSGYMTGSFKDRQAGRVQCQAIACTKNLLLVPSEDRPGRRHHGKAPQWSVTSKGTAFLPSCLLDVADASCDDDNPRPTPRTPAEIARILGWSKRRVEQVLKKALEGQGGVALATIDSALLDDALDAEEEP